MDREVDTDRYFIDKQEIPVDDEASEYQYEEVPLDDDFGELQLDEDLENAVHTLTEEEQDVIAAEPRDEVPRPAVTQKPEVVDDFVRNFLVRMGLSKTLDTFQTEWYEMDQKGLINLEDLGSVPDVYSTNQQLSVQAKHYRSEAGRFKRAALQTKESFVKMRKERDYHRMHHKRIVQEKNKLITDLKRLKEHYAEFEPTLMLIQQKYETAMKQNMLSKLERDRAMGQVQGLQNTLKNIQQIGKTETANSTSLSGFRLEQRGSAVIPVNEEGLGPTQQTLQKMRKQKPEIVPVDEMTHYSHPNDSKFPVDMGVNPNLSKVRGQPSHLTQTGGLRKTNAFHAHEKSISSVKIHPRKDIIATTSDDSTWKMWALPTADIIMTGEGHTDWVADCDFHPAGGKLATVSGDTTVKIWDFAKAQCEHTFTEHLQAVWGCSWHSQGDFLATCSMDNTSKIWDINSLRCRQTLRGHADSVNSIEFLPYSNTLLTSSADKTISLWDARTGICGQTFYGHLHSTNYARFNSRGDKVASCDSFGFIKLWDVRVCKSLATLDLGPYPGHKLEFDPSGMVLAIASGDKTVKMYAIQSGEMQLLTGHSEAVQCLTWDHTAQALVTGGSDALVIMWT